jgi:hypothetical protein
MTTMDTSLIEYMILKHLPEVSKIRISLLGGPANIVLALVDQESDDLDVRLLNIITHVRTIIRLYDEVTKIENYYLTFADKKRTNVFYMSFDGNVIEEYCNGDITKEQITTQIHYHKFIKGQN